MQSGVVVDEQRLAWQDLETRGMGGRREDSILERVNHLLVTCWRILLVPVLSAQDYKYQVILLGVLRTTNTII